MVFAYVLAASPMSVIPIGVLLVCGLLICIAFDAPPKQARFAVALLVALVAAGIGVFAQDVVPPDPCWPFEPYSWWWFFFGCG